jgi:hypothetical protein
MTRPMSTQVHTVMHHVRAHSHGYADASIVIGTVLFLIIGALIALAMLPNLI